jgi:N-acyl homoserine lactone hydrolase
VTADRVSGWRRGNVLHVLRLGTSRVDKAALLLPELEAGVIVETPVYAYLIEAADGRRILVDTGMHPVHIREPHAGFDPWFASVLTPQVGTRDRLAVRLGELGLQPSDISAVINTHLHFDHAGANALFPGVSIHVQREHHAWALGHPSCPSHLFDLPELRYELLDGEGELFDGVELLLTPGHAPAHQSLLVTLASGARVLLCADAILSRENLERDSFGSQPDPETARSSAARLVEVAAQHDALMIFGHDPVQMHELRYGREAYG